MLKRLTLLMTAFAATLALLDAAWADAWRPRDPIPRSRWCEENLRLPDLFSAQPGPFSFAGREYQREILDAIDDPTLREVIFVAVPQVGKSEIVRAICASQSEIDPAPCMLAGPDQIYAREMRDNTYALCEASPALAGRVPPERLRNDRWIDLDTCVIYLAWSGSSQRLSGRSCKIVLASEADRWQLTIELAKKRTRAFWRSMFYAEGSPVGESPILYGHYKKSDRRTYRVPCPRCGHYQELRIWPHRDGPHAGRGGLAGWQHADGRWLTPDEARRQAHYLCLNGCRIESREKPAMIAAGVWTPDGCDVRDGKLIGTPSQPGRRRGYRLNALYAPTISFGDAAEEWLKSRDTEEGTQSFFNDWAGLPYAPRGTTPRWEDLGRRLAASYSLGYVPAWAYFLVAGCDVQADCVYWIVRAFGDGCRSALVDFGRLQRRMSDEDPDVESQLASDLAQLDDAVLKRKWPVLGENPLGFSALAVCKLGSDSGHRPTDVYAFVHAHPGDRVVAVAGDPKISPGVLYRPQRLERNARTGEVYAEGTMRWGIDTSAYKADIMGRWQTDRAAPGAWLLPADILDHEDYLRQVTNQKRIDKKTRGRKHTFFEPISGDDDHYLDCEAYARALADMVVGGEWNAAEWPWGREKRGEGRGERGDDEPREEDFSAR